jgi:hypothetical protein
MKQTRIEQLAQQAMELGERLSPIMRELNAILSRGDFMETRRQLLGIEKSMRTLESAGVTIPSELTERLHELQRELRDYEQAEQAVSVLKEHFPTFASSRNPASPRQRSSTGRCSIADLFSAGLLQDGMEIFHENKRSEGFFTGVLRKPGHIEIGINGRIERFETPSAAGQRVSKRSTDGWLYWSVRTKDRGAILLDDFRKRYVGKQNG